MCVQHIPESVLDEDEGTRHVGRNCVACVAAVLFNEIDGDGFMTPNDVAAQYDIDPRRNLAINRAVEIFTELTGRDPTPGRAKPWDINAPAGHFAVFCRINQDNKHVIYGRRGEDGCYYLWDPQVQRRWTLTELAAGGYPPYAAYHFEE
jgi:hypothetical protein